MTQFWNPTGSRHASPWAARIYNDAIARGKEHPLAVRILARAWLYVIWECWHNGACGCPKPCRLMRPERIRGGGRRACRVG